MLMPTKILVPTDFSEPSNRALEQALDIAKQYNAKVFIVHVIHEEIPHSVGFDFSLSQEILQEIKDRKLEEAKERMKKQLEAFPKSKDVEVNTAIRQGVSYQEILEEGKEKKADLIVIASLGRTGIAKYLIGSVARNVLKGSKCPVLLTK